MEVIFRQFDLKLEHTFTISRESYDSQPTLVVELKDDQFSGYGEATANPYYGITVSKMIGDIEKIKPVIESVNNLSPEDFWNLLSPYFKEDMFALCALDLAYTDLFTRKKGTKLYEYWGFNIKNNPKTDYTIGIDSIEKMTTKLKQKPWPIYKIKLGTKEDIKIITELRKHTDAIFRVDANCGWTVEETISNAIALKDLGVEFIEQPLQADNWEGHRAVFLKSVLPIIADESCQVEADVMKCYNHFHGINVKLVKCGGLTSARRMLLQAKKLEMKTMIGCMTESTVGISAIAHLLPLLDYVDMDGALLLAQDIAIGVTIKDGVISYSDLNGTGVTLL
jgi:L-alanine-DL-glutamate epimerase-like enolase superfamily enzyme